MLSTLRRCWSPTTTPPARRLGGSGSGRADSSARGRARRCGLRKVGLPGTLVLDRTSSQKFDKSCKSVRIFRTQWSRSVPHPSRARRAYARTTMGRLIVVVAVFNWAEHCTRGSTVCACLHRVPQMVLAHTIYDGGRGARQYTDARGGPRNTIFLVERYARLAHEDGSCDGRRSLKSSMFLSPSPVTAMSWRNAANDPRPSSHQCARSAHGVDVWYAS